jgi:hypothetical protein
VRRLSTINRGPAAVGCHQRALPDQHPHRRAIAPYELDLDLVAVDVTLPHPVQVGGELAAALGIEGVEDGEPVQLGLVDAVHLGDPGVGVDRAALEVEHPDAVGRRLGDVAIQRGQAHQLSPAIR